MKRILLLACLIPLVFSCEDEGPDACYAVDITEEECLARGECTYLPSFFAYTDDQGCLVGESRSWFPGRSLFLGVCAEAVEPPEYINNHISSYRVCLRLTSNLHAVIDTSNVYDAKLPDEWKPCYYDFEWMFVSPDRPSAYFTDDCRPRCGDGIVDAGETCEATIPLSFQPCSDLGNQLERDYLSGELSCFSCTLNTQDCGME